jgi:hypothetical protein
MYIIKNIKEKQYYVRTYKDCKFPNFSSSIGFAKKYRYWIIAKIIGIKLGNCIVEKIKK